MRNAVTDYLDELNTALRVRTWRQRRITAEVSDHLAELIADERERGADPASAVARAVERFGAPAELAAEFNADAARHGLNRASWALAGCAAAAFAAAGLSLHPGAAARPWPSGPVFSLAMQLWVQVPVACGAIALFLSVIAPWMRGVPLTGRPAALAGRNLAVASVLLLPVAVVAAGNLGTGMPFAERLPLAIVAAGAPMAAIWGMHAASRASWLGHQADGEDVLDVIAAVGGALARRWTLAGRANQFAGDTWRAARARAPRLTLWLDLRHHPWRAAVTMSLAAGLALKTPDLLTGDPDFLDAAVEAVAVYVCFTALGGLLGLRGERARDMRNRVEIAAT
jgi:hypothetical protein